MNSLPANSQSQNPHYQYLNSFLSDHDNTTTDQIRKKQQKLHQYANISHKAQTQLSNYSTKNDLGLGQKNQLKIGIGKKSNGLQLKQTKAQKSEKAFKKFDQRILTSLGQGYNQQNQYGAQLDNFRKTPDHRSGNFQFSLDVHSPTKAPAKKQFYDHKKSASKDNIGHQSLENINNINDQFIGSKNITINCQGDQNQGRNIIIHNNQNQIIGFYNNYSHQSSGMNSSKDLNFNSHIGLDRVKELMLGQQPLMDPVLGGYLDQKQFPMNSVNTGDLLKRNASEQISIKDGIQKKGASNKYQNATLDQIEFQQNPLANFATSKNNSQLIHTANQSVSRVEVRPKLGNQHPFAKQLTDEYSNEVSQHQIKKTANKKKYSSKLIKEGLTINQNQHYRPLLSPQYTNQRDGSQSRGINSSRKSMQKQQLFKPSSLKQLMPTIDQQIMKLQQMTNNVEEQNSTSCLFKQLQQKSGMNSNMRSQQATQRARVTPIIANHPELELNRKENDKEETQEVVAPLTFPSSSDMSPNLQDIFKKTSNSLIAYAKVQQNLLLKIKTQDEEIQFLKERLAKYEQV